MKRGTKYVKRGCAVAVSIFVALYAARQAGSDGVTVARSAGSGGKQRTSRTDVDRAEEGMRATRTTRPEQSPRREKATEEAVVKSPEDEAVDDRPIYTMETLPKGAGIHRVEVDGEVLELAVDHPHDVDPAKQEVVEH